jgi:hypothetical protein
LLRDQVTSLQGAGAAAALTSFPEWAEQPLRPTLIDPGGIEIPVYALTEGAGEAIATAGSGAQVRLTARVDNDSERLFNVIADSPDPESEGVVMLGGHLDSVLEGPGVNDNGSGTATILELAERLAEEGDADNVRFAFWAAEEFGLIGSREYVDSLSSDEIDAIDAYLNFDMLGSPNGARLVYSAEGLPAGSDEIERAFMDYFDERDLPARTIDIRGSSDHTFFATAGVAVGGLYSGSDEIEEGEPMDPCYHLACDTLDNVNRDLLEEMASAVGSVLAELRDRT